MHIYSIQDDRPEVVAYGMAKYSRSSKSLAENLRDISTDRSQSFLETFYFQYGHKSIADMAHIVLAIEDISLLAALQLVDEPLWDGQERSTRYQDFSTPRYYTPPGISDASHYDHLMHRAFDQYHQVSAITEDYLQMVFPPTEQLAGRSYDRVLKARALDLARYWLPLGTLTSVGQITSARVLERQIIRWFSSRDTEMMEIATAMKEAVTLSPPIRLDGTEAGAVAPTLIKYAGSSPYQQAVRDALHRLDVDHATSPSGHPLSLRLITDVGTPTESLVVQSLYESSTVPYAQLLRSVRDWTEPERVDWIRDMVQPDTRASYEEWPRFLHQRPMVWEVEADIGVLRDLNRHRSTIKLWQPVRRDQGWVLPSEFWGIESFRIQGFFESMGAYYGSMTDADAPYVLPLAHRRRMLWMMDWPTAAYIADLRSRPGGHPAYRTLAVAMGQSLAQKEPGLGSLIRTTPLRIGDFYQR